MKFNEFYNKQKNVIKSSIAKRLESNIPISEERDAFYRGELFKKYDIVESEGKKYTVLEQASNYYHVVDEEGNLSRKFPKQLTRAEGTFTINAECFHGYKIISEEAQQYLKESYKKQPCEAWTLDNDDVGILKQLKQLDEQMDSSYKSKDKLTVAKIIADAVGVPHDMVSTPENLIAAAIRKAKKDPKLVKNKEILSNMLQIAREVGIKITDDTFVTESEELEEGWVDEIPANSMSSNMDSHRKDVNRNRHAHLHKLLKQSKNPKTIEQIKGLIAKEFPNGLKESEEIEEAILSYDEFTKGRGPIEKKTDAELQDHLKKKVSGPGAATWRKKIKDEIERRKSVKESEEITEVSDTKKVQYIKAARKSITALDKSGNSEKRDKRSSSANHAYNKMSPEARKLANESEVTENMADFFVKAAKDKGMNARVVTPEQKKKERAELDAKRAASGQTHKPVPPHDADSSPSDMYNKSSGGKRNLGDSVELDLGDAETIDESGLSIKTLDSYAEKAREHSDALKKKASTSKKPETAYKHLRKAASRAAGASKAEQRSRTKSVMASWNESEEQVSFKALTEKLKSPQELDSHKEVESNALPHGHTLNPSNEIHRKQLIRKVRGDD